MIQLLLALATVNPSPAPSPLLTITRVKTSATCSALRENVGNAIQGLLANDQLLNQSRILMGRLGSDAADQAESASDAGAAGSASEMDDVHMGSVISDLVANIAKIDRLLNDPTRFPKMPIDDHDRMLLQARAQLEKVADDQRYMLNVVSTVTLSNESNELNSRVFQLMLPGGGNAVGGPPARVSAPEAMDYGAKVAGNDERDASQTIVSLASTCR